MAALRSDSNAESNPESEPEGSSPSVNPDMTDTEVYKNLTIDDFLPRPTQVDTTVGELNGFFNSSQIKQELHWFTHRDTLDRAFEREDRELFHIRPQDSVVAASMVWCQSRVLEPGQAQIRLIATHPDYRGHGFARMLVDACLSFARSYDQTEMIADVAEEAPATEFWEACGFEAKSTYETDGGRTMLRMSRGI